MVQKFYGDREFALGYLTYPDFLFAELAYYIRAIDSDFYAQFPFLDRLRKAFNEVPEIKSYYDKEDAVKMPFMPPYAKAHPTFD